MLALISFAILAGQADPDFALIPAGTYQVGKAEYVQNPIRKVRLKAFQIAKKDVTNADFAKFVQATGYVTDAERLHNGMVFEPGLAEFAWLRDKTATWHYPNGVTRGDINDKADHPVTSISFQDAQAYCQWAGVRLPTLDEWEVASRAGAASDYFWGDDETQIVKFANVWHGYDHLKADSSDGYMYTSPVGHFAPNPFGLYDVYGNVFQFCTGHVKYDRPGVIHARGGSWWCSRNACCFFNSADIGSIKPNASFSNQGFRVVK